MLVRFIVVAGAKPPTSLTVAEVYEIEHKNVLRVIRKIQETQPNFYRLNFEPKVRVVEIGIGAKRKFSYYEMHRPGWMFLTMKLSGPRVNQYPSTIIFGVTQKFSPEKLILPSTSLYQTSIAS
jgi:hypothetical protein